MSKFNIEKQIDYWKNTAKSDLDTAEILISNGKFLHGLFFCHLTIEKALKANYIKTNQQLPPKTHNLIYLMNKSEIALDDSKYKLLGILLKYQLEGRYPEHELSIPDGKETKKYLKETKELLQWLIQKL
jgi:HEPN domain-containing protein